MRAYFFTLMMWIVQGFAAFHLTWNVPAVNLDANPPFGDSDENAKVAIDPQGNALAVWSRTSSNKASEDIWISSYSHTARVWAGAVKISGGGSASNPALAIDKEGNAIIVWEEGFPSQIMSRTRSNSGTWSPPLSLPPTPISSSKSGQTFPQIAIDGKRNGVAIWVETAGKTKQIFSAKLPWGMKWKSLGALSADEAEFNPPSSLVMNESGEGMAVWQEKGSEIHAAKYLGGQWLPSFMVSSFAGQQVKDSCVGIDSEGNALFAWNQIGIEKTIKSKTYRGGVLSNLLNVSDPNWVAQHPSMKVDQRGNGVVVYERYDVGPNKVPHTQFITGSFFSSASLTWSEPQDISGPSFEPENTPGVGYPVLSMNAIGDGVVIWKEFNGENTIIRGNGFSLGSWGLFKTLSMIGENAGFFSSKYEIGVALNLAGNVVAVWPEDSRGDGTHQIKATSGVGLALEGPLPPHLAAAFSALSAPSLEEITKSGFTTGFFPPPLSAVNRRAEGATTGVSYGVQVLHRFAGHGDLINIINWNASANTSHYKVYRENLSTLVGTTKETKFEDHQRTPKERVVYLVTAVGFNDQESGPLTIIVNPL